MKELELFFDDEMIPRDDGAVMQFAGERVNVRDFYWNNSIHTNNTVEEEDKNEENTNS